MSAVFLQLVGRTLPPSSIRAITTSLTHAIMPLLKLKSQVIISTLSGCHFNSEFININAC